MCRTNIYRKFPPSDSRHDPDDCLLRSGGRGSKRPKSSLVIFVSFLLASCGAKTVELPATSPWVEQRTVQETFRGVPVDILDRLIQSESSWRYTAVNRSPQELSVGLAQVNMEWFPYFREKFGLKDPTNPWQSLEFAAKYLRWLYEQTGSWEEAVLSYKTGISGAKNAGPKIRKLARWIVSGEE